MIENTQDMRAYHFMKNIDTGDHDLLIRLISPWRYKDYFDELAEKRYQEQTKIGPLLDTVIDEVPKAELQDILKKCEVGEWDYFSMKSYIMDALRYAYKIIPKVPIDEVDIKKNNPKLD